MIIFERLNSNLNFTCIPGTRIVYLNKTEIPRRVTQYILLLIGKRTNKPLLHPAHEYYQLVSEAFKNVENQAVVPPVRSYSAEHARARAAKTVSKQGIGRAPPNFTQLDIKN